MVQTNNITIKNNSSIIRNLLLQKNHANPLNLSNHGSDNQSIPIST
jgi:hypothetical protein